MHDKSASVRVNVLLLNNCKHLRNVGDKVERLMVDNSIRVLLLSQEVLKLGVMALREQLDEPQQTHGPGDILCLDLVDQKHLINRCLV